MQPNLSSKSSGSAPVAVGDRAPDFTLPDQNNRLWTLRELCAGHTLVLFFYPEDETYGCTREACAFRDAHQSFSDIGARVVGISSDSIERHQRFAEKHSLPYVLLSDRGANTRRAFGVPQPLGVIAGRTTYVIDRDGIVRGVFNSLLAFDRHADEALAMVRALG
jgi:peroxiredoxin Q/BCP